MYSDVIDFVIVFSMCVLVCVGSVRVCVCVRAIHCVNEGRVGNYFWSHFMLSLEEYIKRNVS